MASTIFDTLKFVDRLTASGISEAQARAIADAQREVLSETVEMGNLASKMDIERLAVEIESAKPEVIKWVAGLLVAQATVIAALVKLF